MEGKKQLPTVDGNQKSGDKISWGWYSLSNYYLQRFINPIPGGSPDFFHPPYHTLSFSLHQGAENGFIIQEDVTNDIRHHGLIEA